jgi:hypothetical protein
MSPVKLVGKTISPVGMILKNRQSKIPKTTKVAGGASKYCLRLDSGV